VTQAPHRVASWDIGSNSVILLVAERSADGWQRVADFVEVTRVSEGLDKHGILFREPLERTAAALERLAREAATLEVDAIVATGTAPFRRARNGAEAAAELSANLGATLDIVSGEHEADLSLLATRMSFASMPDAYVVDIGGASTEVIRARADGSAVRVSLDIGTVRLFERHVTRSPISDDERAAVEADIARALAGSPLAAQADPVPLIGIAGTVTTLATMALELDEYDDAKVHGFRLATREVKRLRDAAALLTLSQRKRLPGLPAARADVMPVGGMLLAAIADAVGADEIVVSDRGIRWGRLYEAFGDGRL
jgi:exopolyphosphatase/guanosine-5'-triphosphate,3'-diphosphate pyrophosphatase